MITTNNIYLCIFIIWPTPIINNISKLYNTIGILLQLYKSLIYLKVSSI